jgi:hypothetical protein
MQAVLLFLLDCPIFSYFLHKIYCIWSSQKCKSCHVSPLLTTHHAQLIFPLPTGTLSAEMSSALQVQRSSSFPNIPNASHFWLST